MRERKYVKLKCDMYEDTKFKIIDTMENRDTINYIWTRILALCGKINNSFGYLLVSKNIPYTIEILSIEFNRSKEQVENAIKVFIDLNMMRIEEDKILQVCNWNKHQGINKKAKEEAKKQSTSFKEEENKVKDNDLEAVQEHKQELQGEKDIEEVIKDLLKVKDDLSSNGEQNIVEDIKNPKEDNKLIKLSDSTKKTNKQVLDIADASKKLYEDKINKKQSRKKKKKCKVEDIPYTEDDDSEDIVYFTEGVEEDPNRVVVNRFDFEEV